MGRETERAGQSPKAPLPRGPSWPCPQETRSLSAKEAKEAELVKFRVLSNMKKYKTINAQEIIEAVHNDIGLPKNFNICYQKLIASQTTQSGKEPTVDELRNLQAAVYSLFS